MKFFAHLVALLLALFLIVPSQAEQFSLTNGVLHTAVFPEEGSRIYRSAAEHCATLGAHLCRISEWRAINDVTEVLNESETVWVDGIDPAHCPGVSCLTGLRMESYRYLNEPGGELGNHYMQLEPALCGTGCDSAYRYRCCTEKTLVNLKQKPNPRWNLVYAHDEYGNPTGAFSIEDKTKLVEAVRDGADVKVSFVFSHIDYEEFFSCDSVYVSFDGSRVVCMNTSHISVGPAPDNGLKFIDSAYHWFVLLDTTGKRDMSRWLVGEHTDKGHSQDLVGMKWFVKK